ncbi:MAG: isoleucine--tRNA ligase [Planctomycetota bacterium]
MKMKDMIPGNPCDYRTTVLLPKTDFPMKADLANREPGLQAEWDRADLHNQLRQARAGRPKYILHDGPPYANGNIHIGHALNKILKDMVVRIKSMEGYDAPYIPGWDCHGLPNEQPVDKELGAKKHTTPLPDKIRLCRDRARRFIDIQREEFRRLGLVGDWAHPYVTMDFAYEADILRQAGKLLLSGNIYKGLKPVYWCSKCRTALAEAEVEYADHASPSIFVRFPIRDDQKDFLRKIGVPAADFPVSVLIWTTTPWTLAANLAIAVHADYEYVAVEHNNELLIVAAGLLDKLATASHMPGLPPIRGASFKGTRLEGLITRHPWINRDSPVVLAPYVTLEDGTGCVHTAPGHGIEDYETGKKYGLDIYAPVDADGRYTPDVEHFAGTHVFEANGPVVDLLRAKNRLLAAGEIKHSYPHCWRCKTPVVYRATEQWFISMEANGLREKALAAIEQVTWVPAWGRERIHNMVSNRTDWCISRQRVWGIPIPVLYCGTCEKPVIDARIIERAAAIVEATGIEGWHAATTGEIAPPGLVCPDCGATEFIKERDILDVWFDSGVTHAAVLDRRGGLSRPADLYLEGSDQHRGWFQSSLLTSIALTGAAPYKTVLTHGFVLDHLGRAMHKSLGNVIAPQEIIKKYGADVLRLWVAQEDYRDDVRISNAMMEQLAEAYRKLRNTFRFLLGNLDGFDPARDELPEDRRLEIDAWALARLRELTRQVRTAYDAFEFHRAYRLLLEYASVDLSSFYLDTAKDRLYCSGHDSRQRRSARATLYDILHALVRLSAPLLAHTADEVWQHLPAPREAGSIHLTLFPEAAPETAADRAHLEAWRRIVAVRSDVSRELERLRAAKTIGNSLEAEVTLVPGTPELRALLEPRRADLPMIFIVSGVTLAEAAGDGFVAGADAPGLSLRASRTGRPKCQRCWTHREGVGRHAAHPGLCDRCAEVVTT